MSRQQIVTCPRCFRDDEVSAERAPDGSGFVYTCVATAHDNGKPHVWVQDPGDPDASSFARDGVLDDLYDPLMALFRPGEPLIEHGIVEDRLRANASAVFAGHVHERGHVALGGLRNTASGRIGSALGILRAQGQLIVRRGKGTGAWRYNSVIGFWGLPPSELGRPVLTWEQYAADNGRSAEFTDADRVGLTSPRQGIVTPWKPGDPLYVFPG